MSDIVRLARKFTLAMPAAEFFQAATMTDRVQRLAGVPPGRFQPGRAPDGRPALRVDVRFGTLPAHWYELPFEWVTGHYWRSRVLFEHLPLGSVQVTTQVRALAPAETEVEIQAEVVPRTRTGRLVALLVFGGITLPRLERVYRTLAARHGRHLPEIFPAPQRPAVAPAVLAQRARALHAPGIAPALVRRLVNHLAEALDDDVIQMRPFALADRWDADRLETLRLFLYATQGGLLDMRWDVLCPNCRVPKASAPTLADLAREAHCDTCNIRYDANFDESVELRFSVNGAVRPVHSGTYCVGGPYRTRHILVQADLRPGEARVVPAPAAPGVYRWRTRQRPERGLVTVDPAATGAPAPRPYRFGAAGMEQPAAPIVAPGTPLHFANASTQDVLLMVEQAPWGNDGVSAALVTALQEFRTLFSSQVLAPGADAAIRSLTVLFSDLLESGAAADRQGDAAAYAWVREYLEISAAAVAGHNGAVVKTLGAGIMAVFSVPGDAVAAGLAIQQEIAQRNATARAGLWRRARLGLHNGPCIAITANERLDYFGATVNTAARVQTASQGDDLVLTDRVYDDPTVRAQLADRPVAGFTSTFKGLAQGVQLYRVDLGAP